MAPVSSNPAAMIGIKMNLEAMMAAIFPSSPSSLSVVWQLVVVDSAEQEGFRKKRSERKKKWQPRWNRVQQTTMTTMKKKRVP